MRKTIIAITTAFVALSGTPAVSEPDSGVSSTDLEAARALTKKFAKSLKGELQAAIAEGGPENAISVCRMVAPGIAGQISTESGWAVGRTALKVRNPRNAPSVRERAVLMSFLARQENGESLAGMESAAVIREGERDYLHYMKAIPTGGLCLTCHGSNVAPNVRAAIQETYPADAATGFRKGELRGAFTLVKPVNR